MNYARHFFLNHTLVHIYKGELFLRNQCGESLVIKSGDTAFVGRDSHLQLYYEKDMDDTCLMLFLELPLPFLCEFYHTFNENSLDTHSDALSTASASSTSGNRKSFSVIDSIYKKRRRNFRQDITVKTLGRGIFIAEY